MQNLHSRVTAIFREIVEVYDFASFSIDDFATWISQHRGRPIEFWPLHTMPGRKEDLMGFWAVICGTDAIVYLQNTLPFHQLHIQLHELSHILCGHTTAEFDEWDQLVPHSELICTRMEYPSRSPEEEQEAEILACLLLDEIQKHRCRKRLASSTSSHPEVADYWSAMGTV